MSSRASRLGSIAAIVLAVGFFASPLVAEEPDSRGAALGAFLGQPTGISFRYGFAKDQSIEAKAAWSFGTADRDAAFILQGNWIEELPDLIKIKDLRIPFYFGGGVQVELASDFGLVAQVPVGLAYRFRKAPVELCLELDPGLRLVPETAFALGGGVGCRYRF